MLNLVSDSSCDLISGELNSPYARLTVAPMCLHVGGQDYLDTPELDIPALLSKLAHHRSSSACPRRLCRGLRAGRGNRLRDHLLSAFRLL